MSDLVKELMPYLQKLADKLDSSAQALWTLQMQQAKVVLITGITQYTVLLLCLVSWGFMCKYFNKRWVRYEHEQESKKITKSEFESETFGHIALPVVSMLLMILYYMFKVPSITDLFTIAINPEYWALHELINMVKAASH